MIAIIDYDAGNLMSVNKAFEFLGASVTVTSDIEIIKKADGLILPGVGAFSKAMDSLRERKLVDTIRAEAVKKPFMGICLGMQLLFEKSYEFGETEGLGLIPGNVRLIKADGLKIPHMGWNSLKLPVRSPLTVGLCEDDFVYFVHSYKAETDDLYIAAYTEYGEKIPALVQKENIFGAQFHPEKSGKTGLKILESFLKLIYAK